MVGKSEMHLPKRCPISKSKFILFILHRFSFCEKRSFPHVVSNCVVCFFRGNTFWLYFFLNINNINLLGIHLPGRNIKTYIF